MSYHALTRPANRWRWLLVLAILLFAGQPAQRDAAARNTNEPNAGQKNSDPLIDLNSRFRAAYAQARKEMLAQQGPVLIADGDAVILLRRGQRTEVNVAAMGDIVKKMKFE